MGLIVDIKKKLGNFELKVAFNTAGRVLGLLGASGCGKSMTLRCIAGVEKPDEGKIILNDRVLFDSAANICLLPQERKVGYLFQDYALFPNMTVKQNIICGAKNEKKAEEYIKRYALNGLEKHYPSQLSGGQKQRTALARMLAAEPDAILLDEPFTALDNSLKARLERELMKMMEEYDGPVVFVSHDRNESYRLTDIIAVMENGHISDISEKHELFRAPRTLAATLLTGCKNISRVKRLPDGKYEATDWGIILPAPLNTGDCDYHYAGFRAHDLIPVLQPENAEVREGLLRCELVREIEDTFSIVIHFHNKGCDGKTEYSLITYETGKKDWDELREICKDGKLSFEIPDKSLIWMES